MKLEFDTITIQNFRSFVDTPIEFPLGESGPGLHFIQGVNEYAPDLSPNGAGKSSIWHAFFWCLFGNTEDNLRNPDIRPWFGNGGQTRVAIYLRTDGVEHDIRRTADPNALDIDGHTASQADVYKLIGLFPDIVEHAILLGQGRPLFFDLKAKDKMDLFAQVLDLNRWEMRSEYAAAKAKEYSEKRVDVAVELAGLSNTSGEIERQIDDLKKQSQRWEAERADKVDDSAAKLAELEQRRVPVLKKRDHADLALERTGMELKALRPDIAKQRKAFDEARREARFDELDEEMRLKKTCPTCLQPLTKQHLARLNKDAAKETKEIDRLAAILERLERAQQEFELTDDDARDILSRSETELAQIDAAIKSIKQAKRERESEGNPYSEQIHKLKRRKEAVLLDMQDAGVEESLWQTRLYRAKFWVQGFRDVRLYLIEEILEELQITTNAMVEDFGLAGWQVRYAIERETKTGNARPGLTVSILSPLNDKPVRWEVWSGGESQRLRLIGSLALAQVLLNHAGIRCNLEALDEPTRGLSAQGVRDLCEHLADRAEDLDKTIFLIDHQARQSARFASVITVVRDAEGSFIK